MNKRRKPTGRRNRYAAERRRRQFEAGSRDVLRVGVITYDHFKLEFFDVDPSGNLVPGTGKSPWIKDAGTTGC